MPAPKKPDDLVKAVIQDGNETKQVDVVGLDLTVLIDMRRLSNEIALGQRLCPTGS